MLFCATDFSLRTHLRTCHSHASALISNDLITFSDSEQIRVSIRNASAMFSNAKEKYKLKCQIPYSLASLKHICSCIPWSQKTFAFLILKKIAQILVLFQ